MAARQRIVLASASPRRRDLLEGLGLGFEVRPAAVDESRGPDEAPRDYVRRLAGEKARYRAAEGELVLAADTVVLLDEELMGKPSDSDDAQRMLSRIAGREHTVLTAVALLDVSAGRLQDAVETTRVTMTPLSAEEIAWYVGTGEPLDKAGSYAVQGLGGLFVDSLDGSYSNVVGLPLTATYRLFLGLGHDLLTFVGA